MAVSRRTLRALQLRMRLTQLLELGLVALARGHSLLLSLSLSSFSLEGGNPAVTLGSASGLEGVLLAVDLEVQLGGTFLGNVGDISLASELATGATFIRVPIMFTDQVEDTGGGGLVLGALGEEQKTLAGLAGPSGDRVGDSSLLVLVEGRQLLRLNSIVAEVEEALGETEAPILCHTRLVTAYYGVCRNKWCLT